MTTSLVIPIFNEEKYLPLLLESVILQSCQVDEIIICDNNSTDNSVWVAKSYQDRLPIVIIKQPIKGILPTMEKAWRAATKEIVLRTDADAVLPRHWVENIVRHFVSDPDLAAGGGSWVASDGNIFHRTVCSLAAYPGNYLLGKIRGYPFLLGPNSAFRREALVKVGGYQTKDKAIDDQLITKKLKQHHLKTKWFADCLVYHSTRRYQGNFIAYLTSIASFFNPRMYQEKSK